MRYERIGTGSYAETGSADDDSRTTTGARRPTRQRRWPRLLTWLAVGVVCLLAAGQVRSFVAPAPQVGHWRSDEARERYDTAYTQLMATLPEPEKTLDVPTSKATVRVLVWEGSASGPPVLLVPGHSSGAPLWAQNLPSWIGARTIYALDPVGDAGYSGQTAPLTGPADQATWMAETVQALGLDTVHVVGHSFGGANAAELAVAHPELVASLTLLEPVAVIRPMPASIYLWSAVLVLPTPQSWKDRALAEIGGATVEEVRQRTPMSEMIDAAASGYSTALPMPRELSDAQWASLTMPVRLDIGGASELAGGQKSADRLAELVPDATVTVWPDATHSIPMDKSEELGPLLLDFWEQSS